MRLLAPLVAAVIAMLGTYVLARMVASRLRHWRHRKALRSDSMGSLAREASDAIRSERWDRLEAGSRIVRGESWTEEGLLDALEELWKTLDEEDDAKGQRGRGSNYYEFYDSGLADIYWALRDRLGLPPPWNRAPKKEKGPYR